MFGDPSRFTQLLLTDVTATPLGFVAVGHDGFAPPAWDVPRSCGPPGSRAVVLTSEDGLTWVRLNEDRLPARGEDVVLTAVTSGGPGVVAVGWRGVSNVAVDPVVWTVDGQDWSEAADPQGVFSQQSSQLITDVTEAGPGLVAIGLDGNPQGFITTVWISP